MDINQQQVENLVEYISQTVSLNRRLDKKRVSNATAKLAFTQVDKKRKGYLDLADVYELCGEVTEDELFVAFKWLDASKTGDVTYEDFQFAMGSGDEKVNNNNEQVNPVESVKLIITTFLENWDYSKGSREKLGICEESLAKVYQQISQSQRKSSLTVDDLLSVFSSSKKCDSLCKQEIKKIFISERTITQKVFVEAFTFALGDTQNVRTQQLTINPQQPNEEQLLDDINNQYIAQKPSSRFQYKSQQQVNKFIQEKYPKNICERQNKYVSEIKKQEIEIPQNKNLDFKTGDIDSLLSNIEKRREQLKKGSIERKKLIQEALSRKKTNLTNFSASSSTTETFQPRTYSRPVSTPKSNSYSQVCVNNYVDVNKNDFGKIFNRYRDERQNIYNIESRMKERVIDLPQPKQCQWVESKSPKFMEKTYSTFQDQADFRGQMTPQSDYRNQFSRGGNNYAVETPKFSQTAQERFFQRPMSASKVDRYEQIREKISHLPERNGSNVPKQNKQIDRIIEKYKHFRPESNQKAFTSQPAYELNEYSQRVQQVERTGFSSYLMQQQSPNLRGIENLNTFSTQQRKAPDSYIQDQKSRLNGSIYQYRSSSGNIQKQNLLKRAEEEAARKILEIQRKAKLKVLERKSAVGLKWVK